ncbi:764_t:CDS:1, partial [Ambispora gerdemannii]
STPDFEGDERLSSNSYMILESFLASKYEAHISDKIPCQIKQSEEQSIQRHRWKGE